jgi:hypothetical protein
MTSPNKNIFIPDEDYENCVDNLFYGLQNAKAAKIVTEKIGN